MKTPAPDSAANALHPALEHIALVVFDLDGRLIDSVPDLAAAERWFDVNNVEFKKRSDQGKMKNVIFVKDPDGYWIEVVQPSLSKGLGQ